MYNGLLHMNNNFTTKYGRIMMFLFSFKGSAGRIEFSFLFFLTLIVYSVTYFMFPENNLGFQLLKITVMIISLVIYLSVIFRRLHDIGYINGDEFFIFIPVYNIYLFFLLFIKKGVNLQ
jgi:uncharacterized membrane protein YhaH (DUF805 family)